jgi:hypothetical protein
VLSGAPAVQSERFARVFKNEGSDEFRPAANLGGALFGDVGAGDYDGDGDLDLLAAGDGFTLQYRNDQLRVNDPPTAPTGLTAATVDGGVRLSWEPATDPQTDSPGLTYNLRVGTTERGIDVTSPMSDLDTGQRHVSDMGNVQNNTSWVLRNLPPGTYYWSVQAIDNAYNGSIWAEESTFTITSSSSSGSPTATEDTELPGGIELLSVFPNPFGQQATIELTTSETQYVEARIYSAVGSHVATIADAVMPVGTNRIRWDGLSSAGTRVPAGVYLLRIETEAGGHTVRMVRADP